MTDLAQQQSLGPSVLAEYTSVTTWLAEQGSEVFFPTKASLDWFIKRHRRELVKSGALITREGRCGSLVSRRKFSEAVVDILRRRAVEKMDAKDDV